MRLFWVAIQILRDTLGGESSKLFCFENFDFNVFFCSKTKIKSPVCKQNIQKILKNPSPIDFTSLNLQMS